MYQLGIKKKVSSAAFMLCIILMLAIGYIISQKTPIQEIKITAQTTAEEFDLTGTTDIYYLKPLKAGQSYETQVRFMAVENTSESLFTSHGTGQYVELGCNEMHTERDFISFGKFIRIRLTLSAAQTDLKLEDGTPFDITRHSLRPVLTVEEH